jgi:hypothetical protein
MEKKPEQQLPVNDTQSEQEQIEEALRARIDAARRAADRLAVLLGVTGCIGGRADKRGGPAVAGDAGAASPPPASARVPGEPPTQEPKPRIIKTCDCGKAYTREAWSWLRLMVFQRLEEEDLAIELRECAACRAPVGIVVHVVLCHRARLGEPG